MPQSRFLESEYKDQSDREVLLGILTELRRMNGAVRDHDEALYGEHGEPGLRSLVRENRETIQNWRTSLKAARIWVPVGVLGIVANIVLQLLGVTV